MFDVSYIYKLECNNDRLKREIVILRIKLTKIDKITLHAGCGGNPDCQHCQIQKILKELK